MHLVIDSKAVADGLRKLLDNKLDLPKYAWRQWIEAEEAVDGRAHKMEWCPSHGKKMGVWEPSEGMDGEWLRHMNKMADAHATEALEIDKAGRRLESQWRANEAADKWAEEMLQRQYNGVKWVVENDGLVRWRTAFKDNAFSQEW